MTTASPERDVAQRAAEWLARLWSGDAGEADHAACRAWRDAHPDHERIWLRLQAVQQRLDALPPTAVRSALADAPASPARRQALKLLGVAAVGGLATHTAARSAAWQRLASQHATQRGEVRALQLSDGTRLVLGSASAVDLHFGAQERRVVLRAGEILVATGHGSGGPLPPLLVQTGQGEVRALGTRFTVRQQPALSQVAVLEGAVEIAPAQADAVRRLDAGQAARFTAFAVDAPAAVTEAAAAWTRGQLIAERMRVDDLLAELGRYRNGILRCDPGIAALQVSGVFSLRDTDRALASLMLALPVSVVYRTRYWVSVQPRQARSE